MLTRIGAGDASGWSDFYRSYRGLARHLLNSLAPGGEHLVDDVMQDCAVGCGGRFTGTVPSSAARTSSSVRCCAAARST